MHPTHRDLSVNNPQQRICLRKPIHVRAVMHQASKEDAEVGWQIVRRGRRARRQPPHASAPSCTPCFDDVKIARSDPYAFHTKLNTEQIDCTLDHHGNIARAALKRYTLELLARFVKPLALERSTDEDAKEKVNSPVGLQRYVLTRLDSPVALLPLIFMRVGRVGPPDQYAKDDCDVVIFTEWLAALDEHTTFNSAGGWLDEIMLAFRLSATSGICPSVCRM